MDYNMLSALTGIKTNTLENLYKALYPMHTYIMQDTQTGVHERPVNTFIMMLLLFGTTTFNIHINIEKAVPYHELFGHLVNSICMKQGQLTRAIIGFEGFKIFRLIVGHNANLLNRVATVWIRAIDRNRQTQRLLDLCCDLHVKIPKGINKKNFQLWHDFIKSENKEFQKNKKQFLHAAKHYKGKKSGIAYIDGVRLAEQLFGMHMIHTGI